MLRLLFLRIRHPLLSIFLDFLPLVSKCRAFVWELTFFAVMPRLCEAGKWVPGSVIQRGCLDFGIDRLRQTRRGIQRDKLQLAFGASM